MRAIFFSKLTKYALMMFFSQQQHSVFLIYFHEKIFCWKNIVVMAGSINGILHLKFQKSQAITGLINNSKS